jgi:hypothetical protein
MSEKTQRLVEEIRSKIGRLSRRITLADLVYGSIVAAGAISGALLLGTLTEWIFWMPEGVRWVLFVAFLTTALALLAYFVVRPALILIGVSPGIDETEVARRIGRRFPTVRDRLVNLLNLVSGARSPAPEPLVEGAIVQLAMQVRDPDYESVEQFTKAKEVGRFATVPIVGLMAFLLIDPSGFTAAAGRLVAPGVHFVRPAPFQFTVQPGNATVIKGDSLDFLVLADGSELPESAHLEIKRTGETRTKSVSLVSTEEGVFVHTERRIRDSFTYRIVAGEVVTEDYDVDVVARPFVRSFQVTVQPPEYTRMTSRTLAPNVGDFAAYPGSRVDITVVASTDIDAASVEFDEGAALEMDVNGQGAAGVFIVDRDDSYRIRLSDRSGLDNDELIAYRIQRKLDGYPGIAILSPEPLSELTDELAVEVAARITDDFGFTSLSLLYRLSESTFGEPDEEFTRLRLERPRPRLLDQDVLFRWELSEIENLDLVPGDVLDFYLEVRDNDDYAGFKRTASPIHTLRFPSLIEQFDQLDEQQDEVKGDLESLLDNARNVQEEFEQLRDELRRKQDGSWDDERQLDRLLEQQQELEKQANDLSSQVDQMVDQMEKQDLVSPQTLEQFQELNRVFEEINSPELEEALERLREAMSEVDLTEIERSIGEVEFNEEQFLERLERALELFKRLRTEQKLEEAARRAEELAERQEKLQDKTKEAENPENDSDPSDQEAGSENSEDESSEDATEDSELDTDENGSNQREELAQEQERSAEDMKALEELMRRIEEQMEELKNAPQESMDQLMEQMDQQDMSGQMQDNAQQLRQGEMGEAQQSQEQMMQQLQQMSDQLEQMGQQMSGEQMQQNLAALRRALDDVLTLSLAQEELRDQVREVAARDAGLRRFTQQQAELHSGLTTVGDSLVEMAKDIPQMSREIQAHAGQADMDMTRAVDEMAERRGAQAVGYQKGAMTSLNELALLLSDLMQNMQNQQSGMGGMSMQQMMQQMQQMSGNQAKLNQQIQQMLNSMQGSRLSQDMGKRLQQMAEGQEALRRQLEEMGTNAPAAAEQILGDLEKIAEQMEESIQELQDRNLDSQTIQRQQEILTRLLNAQRSMQERGKEHRREGRTGEDLNRASPSELTPDERAEQLRRELLDALESGYSSDYEELIRRYFEILQELDGQEQ